MPLQLYYQEILCLKDIITVAFYILFCGIYWAYNVFIRRSWKVFKVDWINI
jgi:hypothetical protein